jgi:hypothetical protein
VDKGEKLAMGNKRGSASMFRLNQWKCYKASVLGHSPVTTFLLGKLLLVQCDKSVI